MDSHLAERTILGAMLSGDVMAAADACAELHYTDFMLASHQDIFAAMDAMYQRGMPIDMVTFSSEMGPKRIDAIGGMPYLFALTEGIPRRMAIGRYLEMVQDRSLARRGVLACQSAQTRLVDPTESAAEVLDELGKTLLQERPENSATVESVIPAAMRCLDDPIDPIATGIPELDDLTSGGMRPKELWVVGAKPSGGKSSLCRQIERAFLTSGHGVHSHSIEVPKEDWTAFHIARVAGIPAWKLRQPRLMSPMDKENMRVAAAKVAKWPQMIDDAGSVHIRTLLAKSRLTCMRRSPKLYTVDYLQMIKSDERDVRIRMGEISRALKVFAKENGVTVLLLSQMKRSGDPNARPTVEDLKESGDIEAAADVIVLNYRPKENDIYTGQDELIVGKQRNGPVGPIPMTYNTDTLSFESRR